MGLDKAVEETKYRMSRYSVSVRPCASNAKPCVFCQCAQLTSHFCLCSQPNMLIIPPQEMPLRIQTCAQRKRHAWHRTDLAMLPVCCAAFAVHGARSGGEAQVPAGRPGRGDGVRGGQGGLRGALVPRPGRLHEHAGARPRSPASPARGPALAPLLTPLVRVRSTRSRMVRRRPLRTARPCRVEPR